MFERTVKLPHPGQGFVFRWRSSWWPFVTECGAGLVLALEPQTSIVHVRILGPDPNNPVLVGHLPIQTARLAAAIHSTTERAVVPQDSWAALSAWREARARGEAGAFSVRLARAVELAWDTVGTDIESVYIESAYPTKSRGGTYSTVRVVACKRTTGGA
jgi:hypothetical protein